MPKSARINFGIPDSEYIVKVDDTGAATSCYNQDTDTEYVGGGGGDFSTATVTVANNTNNGIEMALPFYVDANEMGEGSPATSFIYISLSGNTSHEYKIVLYKNQAMGMLWTEIMPFTSGNVSFSEGIFTISGDGSISFS